jgi:heme exporter protein D
MSEIFSMSGVNGQPYEVYVWGSVLVSVLVILLNWLTARQRFKSRLLEVKSYIQKNQG